MKLWNSGIDCAHGSPDGVGERGGADRRDVDQQRVGVGVGDRVAQVADLVPGALGERSEGLGERLLHRCGLEVGQRGGLDRRGDRSGVEAELVERCAFRRERAHVDFVTAVAQFQERGHDRVEVPAGGRGVRQVPGHHDPPSSRLIRSTSVRSVSARLSFRSRRRSRHV